LRPSKLSTVSSNLKSFTAHLKWVANAGASTQHGWFLLGHNQIGHNQISKSVLCSQVNTDPP